MRRQINPLHPPRVAVFVDTSTSWGRQVVAGIHHYVSHSRPWHIFIEASGQDEFLMLPDGWEGDGIIARIGNAAMARAIRKRRLPTVNVSGIHLRSAEFPTVCTDLRDSGRTAAEHLLRGGFRHFAYFSLQTQGYLAAKKGAFINTIREAGYRCFCWQPKGKDAERLDWHSMEKRLIEWLARLPKPIALFAANAGDGRRVIHACQFAGWDVPEDVAVLSGSDDELLGEISNIPMSGVAAAAEQIGRQAAAMLDLIMQGKRPPKNPVIIPPLGVVTRQSTDTLAVKDPILANAVRFIREHAHLPIQVRDVVEHTHVSRRVLERKFKRNLQRTVAHEIRMDSK